MIRILEDFRLEYEQKELDKALELWEKGWSYLDIAITLEIEELEAFLILAHLDSVKGLRERAGAIFGSVDNDDVEFTKKDTYMRSSKYYHPNDGKPWTVEDLRYLVKFYEFDGPKNISLALGRTCKSIKIQYQKVKKNGELEFYR